MCAYLLKVCGKKDLAVSSLSRAFRPSLLKMCRDRSRVSRTQTGGHSAVSPRLRSYVSEAAAWTAAITQIRSRFSWIVGSKRKYSVLESWIPRALAVRRAADSDLALHP